MTHRPARALLLAAGRGERLQEFGRDTAKCLLHFEDRSLLERHAEALAALGVEELFVVTGYRRDEVERELRRSAPLPVRALHNRDYERGSLVSLWRGREALRRGGELLLMDADVLYAPEILERLCSAPGTGLLLDRACDLDDPEPVKVCVRGGRVVEFSKEVAAGLAWDCAGESVGFFRLSEGAAAQLAGEVESRVAAGRLDEPYESALRAVLLSDPDVRVHDISGLPWIEIDFPVDIERARREVLPRLAGSGAAAAGTLRT